MDSSQPQYPNLLIVIGASAGGLQQIVKIIRELPDYFQATVLFACHRDPKSPNVLHEILAKNTDLKVKQPIAGEKLVCTTIYVGKPEESVEVEGRHLRTEIDISDLARMERIDDLFKSAAQSAGENAVGVILTGMLSDGVEGLKAINEAGGYCMVQDPDDAEFESMPVSALKEVDADFVGTTDAITQKLISLAEGRVCK
ncbi:MAG: chemotaxis protein CheB [Lacipirellulaceae bacterium]